MVNDPSIRHGCVGQHDLLILQRAQLRGQHTDVSHLADGLVGLDPVSG
jgi:hypothetical protein